MFVAILVLKGWVASTITLQVHESQIIGELGKGYKYAIEVLNIGRIGIGAQVLLLCVLAVIWLIILALL